LKSEVPVTFSSTAYDESTVWDRNDNRSGWTALLGTRVGTDDVSPYAAPARATELAGLPPTFLDVGEVETFRDESIDYARRLLAAGVSTELHVYSGAFHGFDLLAPDSRLARLAWSLRWQGSCPRTWPVRASRNPGAVQRLVWGNQTLTLALSASDTG
jgi:acetyl esterase/lipase